MARPRRQETRSMADRQQHSRASAPASPIDMPRAEHAGFGNRRRRLLLAAPALALSALALGPASSVAQDGRGALNVVIGGSTGIGISYLPLTLMVENHLLEKHAAAL